MTTTLEVLYKQWPDYAKDTRLNLSSLVNGQAVEGLSAQQVAGIALASAYASQQPAMIEAVKAYSSAHLTPPEVEGVKVAVSLMAMTNIYYRFTHMVSDTSFQTLPAKLRMNKMANPGIAAIDFDLYCLAVSAINGCGLCMDSHTKTLQQHGLSAVSIQAAVRIAAVIHGAAQSYLLESV